VTHPPSLLLYRNKPTTGINRDVLPRVWLPVNSGGWQSSESLIQITLTLRRGDEKRGPESECSPACLGKKFGIPSSGHPLSNRASRSGEDGREVTDDYPFGFEFTSGGIKSSRLGIRSVRRSAPKRRRGVTRQAECSAIAPSTLCVRQGWKITGPPVTGTKTIEVEPSMGSLDDQNLLWTHRPLCQPQLRQIL
jgi:hypothetical protein